MISEEQLKGSINTPDRQLLWDIRVLLRELAGGSNRPTVKPLPHPEPESPRPMARDTKKLINCKKCGASFDNRGKFLSHSRNHKKEDAQ